MKVLISTLLVFGSFFGMYAQSEAHYISEVNQKFEGQIEVSVYGGRADIVNDEYALEIEHASKWKSAIGQALWYGLQTNKKPGIVLIMHSENDMKYGIMLESALKYAGVDKKIKVWFYPYDFDMKSPNQNGSVNQQSLYNGSISNSIDNTKEQKYWLSSNSKVRHNSSCRWFMKSKGRFCRADEGRPCSICGG